MAKITIYDASAIVEIWQPVSNGIERLAVCASFQWDVAKDWNKFVSEVVDTADEMLMNNDPDENAYIVMQFTTKDCEYRKRQTEF